MSKKLRFAVVGCGRMGLRRMQAIMDHPLTELVCVADSDDEKARQTARDMRADFTSTHEALKRNDVDCVVAAVPNKFHPSVAIPALEAGKHVWCEKPLARNLDEGTRIVEAALWSQRFLKIGSNLRYFPNVMKAKELLDTGSVGEILFARGWIGNSGWQLSSWYSDADLIGAGTLLDNGTHLLDIYRWFLGEALECTGYVATVHWPVGSLEDNAMAIFKFTGARLAFLHSSWTEWDGYAYLEVYGSDGFLCVDSRQQLCRTTVTDKNGHQDTFDFSSDPPQSYRLEFESFVQDVMRGNAPKPNGFDGLRAIQMAYGVYQSSRLGRAVGVWGESDENLSRSYRRAQGGD